MRFACIQLELCYLVVPATAKHLHMPCAHVLGHLPLVIFRSLVLWCHAGQAPGHTHTAVVRNISAHESSGVMKLALFGVDSRINQ